MVKYVLAVLLFLAAPLQAEIIKFAWDKPLSNQDGSPLVISGYRFYFSTTPGLYGPAITTLPATATTYSWVVPTTLASAKLYATITAYNGVGESERSNEIVFTTAPKPGAATGLRVAP